MAVFEVSLPLDDAADLVSFETELGKWSRSTSILQFEQTNQSLDVGGTLLDTKDCLRKLRADDTAVLVQPLPGLYYRSDFGEVVIVLPDEQPGTGILFTQGG